MLNIYEQTRPQTAQKNDLKGVSGVFVRRGRFLGQKMSKALRAPENAPSLLAGKFS
jgi:hypothetical protein